MTDQTTWRPEHGLPCDFCDEYPCTCAGEEVGEYEEVPTPDAPETPEA